MNLTDPEKLILLMLSDIHKHLKIDNGIDAEFVESAILSGNTWGLYWKFTGIEFEEKDLTPANVEEVLQILEMWEALEISYDRLSTEDKKRMEADTDPFVRDLKFNGFDGNNESEQINIAEFIIKDLDRFGHFKGRQLNSHMPLSLERYRRMLPAYKRFHADPLHTFKLSAGEIREILCSATPLTNDSGRKATPATH